MRSLGFIPIKSRRFMPGGYRDTVSRGWAHPVRDARVDRMAQAEVYTKQAEQKERKEACHETR